MAERDANAPQVGDGSSPPSVPSDASIPQADGPSTTGAIDAGADVSVPGQPFPSEGFGAGTLGGWQAGHDVYHVTSSADDGAGTLRQGTRTNDAPRVILFDLDGDIALASPLVLPSNLTIDGRGRKVALRGKGLVILHRVGDALEAHCAVKRFARIRAGEHRVFELTVATGRHRLRGDEPEVGLRAQLRGEDRCPRGDPLRIRAAGV